MGSSFVVPVRQFNFSLCPFLIPPRIFFQRALANTLPACMSPSQSLFHGESTEDKEKNPFRHAQRGMINIEQVFIMVFIQQNLLNIFDVLGVVLSTEDIQLSKPELSKTDLRELAGMKHRHDDK